MKPLLMALRGMLGEKASPGSCAMVMPPASLTAATPA